MQIIDVCDLLGFMEAQRLDPHAKTFKVSPSTFASPSVGPSYCAMMRNHKLRPPRLGRTPIGNQTHTLVQEAGKAGTSLPSCPPTHGAPTHYQLPWCQNSGESTENVAPMLTCLPCLPATTSHIQLHFRSSQLFNSRGSDTRAGQAVWLNTVNTESTHVNTL